MPPLFLHSHPPSILNLFLGCWALTIVSARLPGFPSETNRLSYLSRQVLPFQVSELRGGSSADINNVEEDQEIDQTLDITQHPEFSSLQSYRMQQQVLLQLRSTYLSEALAKRGLPVPTLSDVATPDGAIPPQPVDWDCAMATQEDPRSCLYSFEPQPGTKVVAPLGSQDWISLAALNRLRRDDPTKVEPMWHSKYAILNSWFHPESEFSLLQHVGVQGFLLNALLQGVRLQLVLTLSLMVATIIMMPTLEYFVNRLLVSGFFWIHWHQWYRWVHAALPLKLLMGQVFGKFLLKMFEKLVAVVKDRLVEMECEILEQSIPLTIGVSDILFTKQKAEQIESDLLFVPAEEEALEEDYNTSDEE